jgi:hypothetical protein
MPSGLTKMMFWGDRFGVRGSRFEVDSEADEAFDVRRSTFEIESEADGTFDVRRSTFEVESEADESLLLNFNLLSHSHSTSNPFESFF